MSGLPARRILVIGATGTQGGATARALLSAGRPVRALVRNPESAVAQQLAAEGAEVVRGDLDEHASINAALHGVDAVFSVQRPDDGTDSERRQGLALVEASAKGGVRQFVHSSVCHVDSYQNFAGWNESRWDRKYWTDKWEVENAVRSANFPNWTILRPSFILQNFLPPKVHALYPQMREGMLATPIESDAVVQIIAGEDIGAFACAAFLRPEVFDGQAIELASDSMSIAEIAKTFSKVLGVNLSVLTVSPEEAIAGGQPEKWVRSQEWINEVGYHIDITRLDSFGVNTMPLTRWIDNHHSEFEINSRKPEMG